MTVYTRKQTQPLKWLLAIIILALGLTLTTAEVGGAPLTDSCQVSSTAQISTSIR